MGCPCGHVFASPIAASMRSSSTGDIACSRRSASSWTSSQGTPSMSVRKRSISRWRDDVAGFERDLRAREGLAETGAQFLAQRLASGRGGFQRDLDDRLLGPAGEQVDQIHRVAGRYDAHEVAGDLEVVGSDVDRKSVV